jgi:Protein of unknown function (DUF1573)
MRPSLPHALLAIALALAGCDDDATTSAGSSPSAGSVQASATPAGAAPKIVAVEPLFEFGKVKMGSTVEHVFKVRNAGSAPLAIKRAKGS